RVQRMLEAHVGFGNAVVEVSVDTVTESEAISERTFDPETRVAISTDTEERSNTAKDAGGGDVTVASNLPDNEGGGGDSSSSQNSETRERINYEVSEISREIIRAPGAIKRLSVAVLVNDLSKIEGADQNQIQPRTEAEIASLRELVASAVGFDEARGDVITIKSMVLQSTPVAGTAAGTTLFGNLDFDLMSAIQLAVLAAVTLILSLFVIRPLLLRQTAGDDASLPALPPAVTSGGNQENGITGEVTPDDIELANLPLISTNGDSGGSAPDLPMLGDGRENPVDRLRDMIGERQEETVEILRGWLEEKEENA
ncbi:MAG: flagellar M-ring protein FliF C-terminal domain-containing protein, partial [Sulfitobacter sp.]